MEIKWIIILKNIWPVFLITTVYSYLVCFAVGALTQFRAKGNRQRINEALEKFIISPFYVATFFSLLSVLLFEKGVQISAQIDHFVFLHVLIMGVMVFIAHIAIEVLESTLIWKNPLRILEDKEALQLSGIYLIIILLTTFLVYFSL